MKKAINFFVILSIVITTFSCGGLKKVDQRERPTIRRREEDKRLMKVEEGINDLFKNVLQILNLVPQIL